MKSRRNCEAVGANDRPISYLSLKGKGNNFFVLKESHTLYVGQIMTPSHHRKREEVPSHRHVNVENVRPMVSISLAVFCQLLVTVVEKGERPQGGPVIGIS